MKGPGPMTKPSAAAERKAAEAALAHEGEYRERLKQAFVDLMHFTGNNLEARNAQWKVIDYHIDELVKYARATPQLARFELTTGKPQDHTPTQGHA